MTKLPTNSSSNDKEDLAAAYRALYKYSIEKNAIGIQALLAPTYELIHMTGMRQSAQEYVSAVVDGTLNYFDCTHETIEISLDETHTHARVVGQTRVRAAVFGGGTHAWQLQQDMEAEKISGTWKFTHSRASTY